MTHQLTRRDFLTMLAASAGNFLLQTQQPIRPSSRQRQDGDRPNILILVYDTLAASHMSIYDYPRATTPHLATLAERSSVYHAHYAAGNFTTPGTASLLTGAYPWSHRAFNISASIDPAYNTKSIFHSFAEAGYHTMAYTHNWLAHYFLAQFAADIDLLLPPSTFFLTGTPMLEDLFAEDVEVAARTSNFLTRLLPGQSSMPGSLFLSLFNEGRLEQYEATGPDDLRALFPEGLPEEGYSKSFFLLEHAIDGIIDMLDRSARPFLAYVHLYPPHFPYNPRRDFIGRFDDKWTPVAKPAHHFSTGEADDNLNRRRQRYDEYLAYADAEFGRLYVALERMGVLDNSYLIFTSDHGEMFERGIKGHNTPVLYDPLVRVPLLVHAPGQQRREDVYTPTSCTDLFPTLMAATGQVIPGWCEGRVLLSPETESTGRSVFALDARSSHKAGPLTRGTIVSVHDDHKLIHYFGYPGYDGEYELYDRRNDPEELHNVYTSRTATAAEMRDELEAMLTAANVRLAEL